MSAGKAAAQQTRTLQAATTSHQRLSRRRPGEPKEPRQCSEAQLGSEAQRASHPAPSFEAAGIQKAPRALLGSWAARGSPSPHAMLL